MTTLNPQWSNEYIAYNQLKRIIVQKPRREGQAAERTGMRCAGQPHRVDTASGASERRRRLLTKADFFFVQRARRVRAVRSRPRTCTEDGQGEAASPQTDDEWESEFLKQLKAEVDKVDAFYNARIRSYMSTFGFLEESVCSRCLTLARAASPSPLAPRTAPLTMVGEPRDGGALSGCPAAVAAAGEPAGHAGSAEPADQVLRRADRAS